VRTWSETEPVELEQRETEKTNVITAAIRLLGWSAVAGLMASHTSASPPTRRRAAFFSPRTVSNEPSRRQSGVGGDGPRTRARRRRRPGGSLRCAARDSNDKTNDHLTRPTRRLYTIAGQTALFTARVNETDVVVMLLLTEYITASATDVTTRLRSLAAWCSG